MDERSRTLQRLQRSLTLVVRRTAIPRAHERIISRAGVDVDRVEAVALSRICDAGSMTVTELADQLGVACSTAGRHAGNLERSGLADRSAAPTDRRVTVVTATDRGVDLVERLREVHCGLLAEVLSSWRTDELSTLTELLERLGEDMIGLSQPEEARA